MVDEEQRGNGCVVGFSEDGYSVSRSVSIGGIPLAIEET